MYLPSTIYSRTILVLTFRIIYLKEAEGQMQNKQTNKNTRLTSWNENIEKIMFMITCATLLTAPGRWTVARQNHSLYSEHPPATTLPLDKQSLFLGSSLAQWNIPNLGTWIRRASSIWSSLKISFEFQKNQNKVQK